MPDSARSILAVVVAGGSGTRFGDASRPPKQYREIRGKPLLLWALDPFLKHPQIDRVVLVLPAREAETPPSWLADLPLTIVPGGPERGDSVRNGLMTLQGAPDDLVLVHDGARPFVTRELIDRVVAAAARGGSAIPRIPVTDTVKEIDGDGLVVGTLDRTRFWRVQTPQAFPLDTLRMAHDRANAEGISATDDAALFEWSGIPVGTVEGDEGNIKVTTQLDLELAEILAQRLPHEP